jgi:hypothetical protein
MLQRATRKRDEEYRRGIDKGRRVRVAICRRRLQNANKEIRKDAINANERL